MRSTRALGAPVTMLKRLLVRLLRQHLAQIISQQTRFNIQLTAFVAELEERVTELERRAGRTRPATRLMVVHQLLSGAGPVDAVTVQALVFRDLFESWGWKGADVAAYVDPRIGKRIGEIDRLDPDPDDVLLFHYSAYAPRLREMLELPNRKLLISHNVTPPRWLWGYEPMIAVQCAVGPRAAAGVRRGGGSRGRRFVLQRRRAQGSRGGAHDGHSDPVRPTAAGRPGHR